MTTTATDTVGEMNESNEELMDMAFIEDTLDTSHHGLTMKTTTYRGYRHVPHASKPLHVVERRNARERRRVEAVNSAFGRLRRAVPIDNRRGKRMSKVRVLQRAIDYIKGLERLLAEDDGRPYHPISYQCNDNQQPLLTTTQSEDEDHLLFDF